MHSSNTVGVVENHHTCVLHSTVNPQPSTSGQPPAYDSVIDLEAVDAKISQVSVCGCVCQPVSSADKALTASTEFLPDGKHTVVFDFPWERQQPVVEETDLNIPSSTQAVVPPPQQPLETGGTQGDHVSSGGHRGEEMRASVRKSDTIVQITMEDIEGIDEVERRKIANEKWKQRKAQMDTELKRLKHSQRNKERARRRSGSFIHDALQDSPDLIQQRRKVSSSARARSPYVTQQKRCTRTMSMQVERSEAGGLLGFRNPLRPHDEVADEEDAGFGLPPKDIPFFEEKTNPGALDMSQIPVEEIRAMQLENSTNWNTYGEQLAAQDSTF